MTRRIAVLLEPFPVRNALDAYGWIAERLCDMLLREDGGHALPGMRIICNATVMGGLASAAPAARPYLIQVDRPAQSAFTALLADWHTTGLASWSAIRSGSPVHEPLYEAVLASARQSYSFDVLAYWGTNETLRVVAARLGIPVLWAEYGPMRPPFATQFCLDPQGVNGLASSRALPAAEPTGPGLPGVALEAAVGDGTAYEAALMLPAAVQDVFAGLLAFARGQDRVVLLALQLADDANVLAFGNGWTCQAMVEAVLEAQAGPGTVFVLRPHPGEHATFHNRLAGEAVRDLVEGRPDVMVSDAAGGDAYLACLSVATEVVCINSSVGFEASLLGKPVRVLGQASYVPAAQAVADLAGPPTWLGDALLRRLLTDQYIPADRFWTLACWQQAAAAVPGGTTAGTPAGVTPVRLPTVEIRGLGAVHDRGCVLHVENLGSMRLHPTPGEGEVDAVTPDATTCRPGLLVQGWGRDPHTGGPLAGVLIAAGQQSVWCSTCSARPDVARHFADPMALCTGIGTTIPASELPGALTAPVRVYGVTVSGECWRLRPDWMFNPAGSRFNRVPAQ